MFSSIQGLVQWMQGWLELRQRGEQSNKYLKQDIRRHVEDLQDMLEVQDTS